jgi:uncharacterized protein (TIGR03067 family)
MNVSTIWIVSAVLVLTFQQRASPELAKFQGEWALLETADESRADRGDDSIRMIIHGNNVTMTFLGLITNRGTLVVGPMNVIDMRFSNGQVVEGLYGTDGAALTICVAAPGKGRPSALAPKGTQWLERWQRLPSGD